jgi:hypothetical protein
MPPGKTLTVTLTYTRDWGAIGARLFIACGTAPVSETSEPGNTQTLTLTNFGTVPVMARWQVFLRDDTRNSYTMTVALQ